jgi:hypothetical protein
MIVKCSHCGEMFAEKDFEKHSCDKKLNECRFIEVSEIIDCSHNGKRLINGWGTDGILYTFEVVPRKAIPIIEPFSKRKVTDPDWKDRTSVEPIYRGRG